MGDEDMTYFCGTVCQDLPNIVKNFLCLIFVDLWGQHQSVGNRDISVLNYIIK